MGIINLILILFVCFFSIGAGDTDYKEATDMQDMTGGWIEAPFVLSCDGSSTGTNLDGEILDVITFNRFEIPYQAKIHGIEILVNSFTDVNDCSDIEDCWLDVYISNDGRSTFVLVGTIYPNNKTATDYTFGDSGERFSLTWQPEMLNNQSSLAIELKATNISGTNTILVDCAKVKVHYALDDNDKLEYLDFPLKH